MYDELVNLLRRCGKQKCKNCEYEHALGCVTKMNEKAADAIEQLSNAGSAYGRGWTLGYDAGREESKPRWIPVTERLPEPNAVDKYGFAKGYLVKTDRHGMMHTARYTGKWWILWGKAEVITDTVTHWMSLPQAPKEG